MRTWTCCAVAAVALSAAAWAKDGGFLVAFLEASNEFVGKERFGEADVKSFLEHHAAFEATDVMTWLFEKDGKYRYDLVLEDKAFLAWAKERHLDPKPWLRKTIRIRTLRMKGELEPILAHDEKLLADRWKKLEEQRAAWGEKEYEKQKGYLEDSERALKRLKDAVKAIPSMSEEEAALWKKHAKELDRVFGVGEEDGG